MRPYEGKHAREIVALGSDDVANVFSRFSRERLGQVPYGVLQVDKAGVVHKVKLAEGAISGFDHKAAVGKNFFVDIAPCAAATGFKNRFEQGVKFGDLNIVFEWQTGTPRMPVVQIHLKKALADDRYWIFVKRL